MSTLPSERIVVPAVAPGRSAATPTLSSPRAAVDPVVPEPDADDVDAAAALVAVGRVDVELGPVDDVSEATVVILGFEFSTSTGVEGCGEGPRGRPVSAAVAGDEVVTLRRS